ncbi:MAG: glutathione S-transferase [Granulosicoccaceae bacterium]
MHLYLGYKRYSSWSLRPWLAMIATGIPFNETVLPFAHDNSLTDLATLHRIPATVPVLEHEGQIIWDSLAILEYLAETYPEKQLWPTEPHLRILSRSACAEMHSSFTALRNEHPMNCHRVFPMRPSPAVQADLDRLAELWQHFEDAEKPAGNFLCGPFSLVDAMFAPVAWRAVGYQLSISPAFERWSEALMALPAMQQWVQEGAKETWRYESTEQIGLT